MTNKKKILVINGPNLNILGLRDKTIYGTRTYKELEKYIKEYAKSKGVYIKIFQSNSEGDIIDLIQKASGKYFGLIINAAAFSHTSIAIMDSLSVFEGLIYEVHLSNIYNREIYRRHSYISYASKGVISGLGFLGYELALDIILNSKKEKNVQI